VELATLNIPEDEAKEALKQYRNAVLEAGTREVKDLTSRAKVRRQQIQAQDRAILAGYEAIAKHKSVISLSQTLLAGGEDKEHRPRLAIARADERQIEMTRWDSGRVDYKGLTRWSDDDWAEKSWNTNRDFQFLHLLPEVDELGQRGWHRLEAIAVAPHIPPHLRPDALHRYNLLWEADWQRKQPVDPALLRHLRGDLYVVVAAWDLSELERAVLDG
jgi:hypothetical protein